VSFGEPLNELHRGGLAGTVGFPADADTIERHVAQAIEEIRGKLAEADRIKRSWSSDRLCFGFKSAHKRLPQMQNGAARAGAILCSGSNKT
jgi:hypothetical protein